MPTPGFAQNHWLSPKITGFKVPIAGRIVSGRRRNQTLPT